MLGHSSGTLRRWNTGLPISPTEAALSIQAGENIMRRKLPIIGFVLFALVFLFDLVVYGGLAEIPEIGPIVQRAAVREAPLVLSYMTLGSWLDEKIPALGVWGESYAMEALQEGFERIRHDPTVAIDLIFSNSWNSKHGWIKFYHWAAPVLLILSLILWARRPKVVRMMGGRR
jgi:hypothetical protein